MRTLAVLLLLFSARSAAAGTQATLFVAPGGSGSAYTQVQPGSLFAARDYVRTLSTNMTGDIVVYLLGGTYQFTNSLQLQENATNHDSGTGGFNVIYAAYPGQTPVISGGLVLTNWTLFNSSSNIWRTFAGAGVNSRQLYVNGVRAIRARGPVSPTGFATNTDGSGFTTTNTAMQAWGNQTNIEIVQRHNWKQLRCPIASISGTNIVMQTPGWTYTGVTPTPGRPWNGNGKVSLTGVSWVENAYELLASPGMWYLDRATGYLYYIPRPGENLTNGAVVVLPVVEKLVDASGGSLTTPVHNVVVSGITFEYATWLLPSTGSGYADNQTTIMWSGPTNALKTMGNISFQTAANIQITNCVFEHLGGSAVDFGGGAHSNVIIGNFIDDISADGISLGEVIDYATTDPNQMTDGNVIQDNYIRRPGQEYEDAIGIYIGYSKNSTIAHNDVDNTPYSGICLGWGWGTPTYSQNNRVVSNYVGKVMQTLTDGGSVYSLSAQTNSWHIGNYYKDSCYQGIYWDEGSQWWTAVSNVFDNCIHNYINLNASSTNTTGGITNNQNNVATNNFSNVTAASSPSRGVNDVISNTTFVTSQFWPAAAQQIILNAGLEPAYQRLKPAELLVNDSEPHFDVVPSDWSYATARNYGDYHNDLHLTQADGQQVQYTFTASGIAWIGEMNSDEGNVDVYLDGGFQQTVNCSNVTRVTQARLFSATNLTAGPHTLKLVKNGGTYMLLDAFAVTPTNFWLTATTNSGSVLAGNTFSNMVRLDAFGGYSGTTTLSATNLPSGATATFNPPTLTGAGFSVMTVTTGSGTPPGNYELQVTGVGGGVTNIAMVELTVVNPLAGFLIWNGASGTDNNWSDAANWGGTNISGADSLLFSGVARLNCTNDTAAGSAYINIFFNTTAGAFTLNGNPILLLGSISNLSSQTETVNLGMSFNTNSTLGGAGGTLIIGGGLTNTIGAPGSTYLTLGGTGLLTNRLNSTTSPGGTNVIVLNDPAADWTLLDNSSSTLMTVPWSITVSNGTFNFGNATSAPQLNSTSVNGQPQDNQVGVVSGATATFNMVNGTLTTSARLNTALGTSSTGILNQTGGTMNIGSQFQGANGSNPGEISFVNLSGGTMNIGTAANPTSPFYVASRGTGTLNLTNGSLNCGTLDVSRNANGNVFGSIGTVNLNGGTLLCSKVGTATANSQTGINGPSATFNFNGGTLKLSSSTAPFFQGSTVAPVIPISAVVKSGGAFIDTNAKTNTFAEPLLHDAGLGGTADGGLTKNGAGCLILVSNVSYTGNTLVNAGTLALSNAVALDTSPVLIVAAGATLDASGRSDATLTLASGQKLTGSGSVKGNAAVGSGATLAPGGALNALAFGNNLTFNGGSATMIELSHSPLTNDSAQVAGSVAFNGTLMLTNVSASALTAGNSFKLFSAAGYSGLFTNISPVIPAVNLAWNTNGLGTGVVSVVSAPTARPQLGMVRAGAGGAVFSGSNGVPNWTYYVLMATNPAVPVSQWSVIATNAFDSRGNFVFTNNPGNNPAQQYFSLKLKQTP